MNLNNYFDPIELDSIGRDYIKKKHQLISKIVIHDQNNVIGNIENFDIAVFGVENSVENFNSSVSDFTVIREYLYNLRSFENTPKIIDLGNLKVGNTEKDTLIGLRDVFVELISLKIIPLVLGSSELIHYAKYLAFKRLDKEVNLVSIDNKINISEDKEKDIKSVLWKILVEENEALFSFTNIGYQTYFVSNNLNKYLSDQFHSSIRLGVVRSNIKEVEPILRDADSVGLSIASVRQSDAFGQKNASPNGFYGEEICQLAQFAGMSTKLSCFDVNDFFLSNDINGQTGHLIAQILWHFINGYINRIEEHPVDKSKSFKKFLVNLENFEYEIVFYKSENTERWWMEVPSFKLEATRNQLISCTYNDYEKACNGDVPERWLKAFQKIN